MLVTGKPLIVLGMVTAPAEPVYPVGVAIVHWPYPGPVYAVMVTAPLLIV